MLERPESSVSVGRDEWGELTFRCDNNGPVISRTPEELGIPRTVAATGSEQSAWRKEQKIAREMAQAAEPRKLAAPPKPKPRAKHVTVPKPATQRRNIVQETQAAVLGRPRGVPAKRYGMPAVSVVAMDDVPEPSYGNEGIAAPLYLQISELKKGALKVDFETEGHASYVLTKLKKIAKKEGTHLLSSKSAGGTTRWFWLEKPDTQDAHAQLGR